MNGAKAHLGGKSNKVCKTVIMLGGSQAGKTNILQRYTKRRFDDSYIETIGVDYYSKEVNSQYGNMVLSIWDTCGNETELKILPSNIYKICSCYILVCSYDSKESIEVLKPLITHVQYYINNINRSNLVNVHLIPVLILINKCDIKKERKFSLTDVIKLTDEFNLNLLIYEVSAKDNYNLDFVFEKIVGLVNGKLSIANEIYTLESSDILNTTVDMTGSIANRKKSFQLQPSIMKKIKAKIDRDKAKNGSCCK